LSVSRDLQPAARILFHRLVEEFPEVADIVTARIRDNIAALAAGAARLQNRFS